MRLKRFGAFIIDILIVGIVASSLSSIYFINPYYDKYTETNKALEETVKSLNQDNVRDVINSDLFVNQVQNTLKYSVCSNLISLGCYLLYFVGFQKWNKNQTVGKKLMKIKVVNIDGTNKISIWDYAVRTIVVYNLLFGSIGLCLAFYLTGKTFLINYAIVNVVGSLITYAGYLTILFREDCRGLHDILGFTKVIETDN